MKAMIFALSMTVMIAVTSCMNNNPVRKERRALDAKAAMEKQALSQAIRDHSSDFQQVEMVGDAVVYTHIYDGILDVKMYTFDGDSCVAAERVYAFPDQMSALIHYRSAIEHAQLYDDIRLLGKEVKYSLKKAQHELETKGLTKEQLKNKFEEQIKAARADFSKADKSCRKCK